MINVIFMDIDGVLNSRKSYTENYFKYFKKGIKKINIDIKNIKMLSKLMRNKDNNLVFFFPPEWDISQQEEFVECIKSQGILQNFEFIVNYENLGKEKVILDYMKNYSIENNHSIKNYAVVTSFSGDYKLFKEVNRIVETDPLSKGFTFRNYLQTKKILKMN